MIFIYMWKRFGETRNYIRTEDNEENLYKLFEHDTRKNDIIEEFKNVG